ncbi:hypothetical protein GF357_05285 [Candidatus Dojkabacteria bacterium]|nr:hypothetical protein [Candidatus Dojkabacteria bacterium]
MDDRRRRSRESSVSAGNGNCSQCRLRNNHCSSYDCGICLEKSDSEDSRYLIV